MQAEFLLSREQNRRLEISDHENRHYRLHFHSHIEICLVTEGEIEIWINDRRRVLKPGELSVAWSYDAHSYRTLQSSHSLCLIIPPDFFSEYLPLLQNSRAMESFLADSILFERLERYIRAIIQSQNEMVRKGYVYVILGLLLERMCVEDESSHQTDIQLASRVLLYLNQNFHEDLTLPSVACALGYHPSYLSRVFKGTLRIGFHRYLTILRLRAVILLMREGGRSITECVLDSGFQSLRTFYRVFHSEFGCSPHEYLSLNP